MPFYVTTIESPLPPSEAEKALREIIREQRTLGERVSDSFSWGSQGPPFEGTIDGQRFRIRRIIRYRNSFRPIIRGSYATGPAAGTELQLTMHVNPFALALLIVWYAVVLGTLANAPADWFGWWFIIFVPVVMTLGAFFGEAFYARRLIRQALER